MLPEISRRYYNGDTGLTELQAVLASGVGSKRIYTALCSRRDCERVFWSKRLNTRFCSKRCAGWKTGRYKTARGYVVLRLPDGSCEYEHRVVLEKKIGRKLKEGETAHHKNGIRWDNRPANIELWLSQPAGQRVRDIVCMVVERYQEAVERELKKYGKR